MDCEWWRRMERDATIDYLLRGDSPGESNQPMINPELTDTMCAEGAGVHLMQAMNGGNEISAEGQPLHKIPPIIVRQIDNVKEQFKTIHNNINDDSIKIYLSGELIEIYPNSDHNHRNITTMLKAHNYDCFCYHSNKQTTDQGSFVRSRIGTKVTSRFPTPSITPISTPSETPAQPPTTWRRSIPNRRRSSPDGRNVDYHGRNEYQVSPLKICEGNQDCLDLPNTVQTRIISKEEEKSFSVKISLTESRSYRDFCMTINHIKQLLKKINPCRNKNCASNDASSISFSYEKIENSQYLRPAKRLIVRSPEKIPPKNIQMENQFKPLEEMQTDEAEAYIPKLPPVMIRKPENIHTLLKTLSETF
ncbi:hypothetical protein CDAR_484361 [Caerostris darwini]|uniref:Uncharacterized protein n=1 Tax=Caerostris darwini TaxID=1538125 RepID=A0AAV4MXS9_9ARAC|nr:hypothetical protein CDAR_484361 [Caerostris darwini]